MANLQASFAIPPSFSSTTSPSPLDVTGAGGDATVEPEIKSMERLMLQLNYPELRENALRKLSKKKGEVFHADLGMLLWHSAFSPLIQCVASNVYAREFFLNARIVLYLYPLLNVNSNTIPFENLRFRSFSVIEALIKVNDTRVIISLLQTKLIPLCLRTMEAGGELSKTMATFVLEKILLDDVGLRYVCATDELYSTVHNVLVNMLVAAGLSHEIP